MRLADAEQNNPNDTELLDLVDEILDWLNAHEDDDPESQDKKFSDFLNGGRGSDDRDEL